MNRVAIIGAGVLGRQALEIALLQEEYLPVGFYDDFTVEAEFENLPILGKLDAIASDFKNGEFDYLFIAIGYNHLGFKQELFKRFSAIPLANIIHPTAVIEKSSILKGSNLIYADCYIGPHCVMEHGSVLNIKSYLAHETNVGNCTFMSGGINVGGKVNFGERCFIGLGVTLVDDIDVCDDVYLGAGTVVTKPITEKGTYVGTPARKI
jgi:sugar O-acyltransferase (sialic acid O-acetyltransferase NeuD family)